MKKTTFMLTPFTMTDYVDKISAVVWFSGCNMRCLYCYNTLIVLNKFENALNRDDIVNFLNSRKNKLEAIVFSGGECTLSLEFLNLAKKVKELNFKLKVDTNGSNLEILRTAIEQNLIDFIALDFKAPKEKFKTITASNLYDKFIKTLKYLVSINFDFEVRTTIHTDFLDESDISKMAKILYENGYKKSYFLQKFLKTDDNFGNLDEPSCKFNPNLINSPLKIELRNFG